LERINAFRTYIENKQHDQAKFLYKEMQEKKILPTAAMVLLLIDGFGKASRFDVVFLYLSSPI